MNATRWVLLAVVAAVIAGGAVLWKQSRPDQSVPTSADGTPAPVSDSHYPVPEPSSDAPAAPPPAELDGSDAAVRSALEQALGQAAVDAFLVPNEFARRFVALIDSLDRHPVPLQFRPTRHVEGVPHTTPQGEYFILHPEDQKRYDGWVAALDAVDARKAADLYLQYYPLLQKGYEDLGYPGAYFNDRVVKIIDHLLATPEIEGPIELVRPKVLYLFADPALEQRSWGQKALIRMGTQNASKVKDKLRELRELIAVNEEKR
jgi:hypothetical protein